MPMPPCEPVFQVIESVRDGENLEKLSMETTVRNVHLCNPYYRIPRDFNETWLAKVNLGRPPLEPWRPKQNVITALTTLPQGWDLTRKNQCTTAITTMRTESSWAFSESYTTRSCARAMADNRETKGLITPPSRWVSAQLLYVCVTTCSDHEGVVRIFVALSCELWGYSHYLD